MVSWGAVWVCGFAPFLGGRGCLYVHFEERRKTHDLADRDCDCGYHRGVLYWRPALAWVVVR